MKRRALAAFLALFFEACATDVTVDLLPDVRGASAGDGTSVDASHADDAEAGRSLDAACAQLGSQVCSAGDAYVYEGGDDDLVWTAQPDGVFLGHSTGGVMFLDPCPKGAVLAGLILGMGGWLNQVSADCRPIQLSVDTTPHVVGFFSVTLGPRFDTPFAPAASKDPTNQMRDLVCPDGLAVVGVEGTTSADVARYVLGIGITCAPVVVTPSANGWILDVDRTQEKGAGPVVCKNCSATQAFNFTTSIAARTVATGLFGSDGLWVDRVGISTSEASIVLK